MAPTGPGLPPGGRLMTISAGAHRAVVAQAGATLRAYDLGHRPVVAAFAGPEAPPVGSAGEVLAPWPNRVVDGRWSWRGSPLRLGLTEPGHGHALHGLVRTLAWDVVDERPDAVTLEVLLLAHPGWPFPLRCSASYRLTGAGLAVALTATNVGREACPYGAGAHPYLAVPAGPVDGATLRLAAATWLETDGRLAPVARHPTAGTPYDLAPSTPLGDRRLDTAFTDLAGAGGRVEAALTGPDGATTVVWGDASVRWWEVYTGDTLAPPWRRTAVAVEPMTCGPDALNTGADLIVLEPGASHTLAWGIDPPQASTG